MLTQEQIDSFHSNGFLIMRGLIRGSELSMLCEAADRVTAEGIAGKGAEHKSHVFPDGRKVYWRSERMWSRAPIFQAVTVNPELLENIGQCIGKAFYPWNDSLVVKVPKSGAPVKWHQDPPYRNPDRSFTFGTPNFTTDIYLDRSTTDNGCVWAIPGLHLIGNVELNRFTEEELFSHRAALPLEMEPGDVLFHALSTPHGSRGNETESIRRVFYLHYLAEEVYQDGYSSEEWAKEKPGWNPRLNDLVQEMISARIALGLEPVTASEHLRLGPGGFEFTGVPVSEDQIWSEMASRTPSEKRASMKELQSA